MKNKILIYGVNGRIGEALVNYLGPRFIIYGVDVQDNTKAVSNNYTYVKYVNLESLDKIYNENDFYAVIHLQQYKSKDFLKSNLFNLDEPEFDNVINANLKLTLFSCKKYLHHVVSRKSQEPGRIINFGSTYGVISSNPELYEATEMGNPIQYSISKFGMLGLTKYIASYFKKYNTYANLIIPHGIENNQSIEFQKNFSKRSPIGRLSQPEELFSSLDYLLDKKTTYTNGNVLMVDGGWTAC